MRAADIILKKRNDELSTEEIHYFINGYTTGEIPDYQVSALLMAIYFTGMSPREIADLTMAMVNSGDVMDLSSIPGIKVDKHSTGGVADTTTLIAVPLAAACGVPVAKMSGRGLGHTGGTVDKLESIPGFRVSLSIDEFISAVKSAGLAVVSQTSNLVPADKLLYALRDVTGTVDSMPLIASSIMSKKIASGADAIVLDVKAGNGAFMTNIDDAFALSAEMVNIGSRLNRNTIALVTNMDQPLGMAVGNALEVREAIEALHGANNSPLLNVAKLLASYMVYLGGRAEGIDNAKSLVSRALESGAGLKKLKDMIKSQHGDEKVMDNTDILPIAKEIISVTADADGFITYLDTQAIGRASQLLGAGRARKEDKIDPGVGIVMRRRIGDKVKKGDTIAELYVNGDSLQNYQNDSNDLNGDSLQIDRHIIGNKNIDEAVETIKRAVVTGSKKPDIPPLVYGVVTDKGIDRSVSF